jgi:hypothetical protein
MRLEAMKLVLAKEIKGEQKNLRGEEEDGVLEEQETSNDDSTDDLGD